MSWPEMHGAITHFPVALLITAFIYEAGAMVLHRPAWKSVSFWMLVAAVVTAVPSLVAGWMTGNELFSGVAQPPPSSSGIGLRPLRPPDSPCSYCCGGQSPPI